VILSKESQADLLPKKPRPRNPEATTKDILIAARDEFVEHGLNGARIDRIAKRANANKRLIYHYIGNKEELYSRVLLDAYQDIRAGEAQLDLRRFQPDEAMSRLVGFTFDHFQSNPWFLRLLAVENIQRARFVKKMAELPGLHSPIVGIMQEILNKGVKLGMFRKDVDPVQLYISIAGLSYFYFSNIHTLSIIFDKPLSSVQMLSERRAHAIEAILAFLHHPSQNH
jgi:TetR/AcrR family transcriptional regulator